MKQLKSDAVQRTKPCKSRKSAHPTKTFRVNHWWRGTDKCFYCGKTKKEVKM